MFIHKTKGGYSLNNMKKLSIILLLSIGAVGMTFAAGNNCDDVCNTRKNDCDDDCATSTFFRARDITTDLTYRNNLTFYHRYHDAACNFFIWDSALIFQRNRDSSDSIGAGFLGTNPILVAEEADGNINVNSLNLGLGSNADGGYREEYTICPRREVFAWLPQLYFNLDCFCTGTWFEISFAVVRAKHELRQNSDTSTENNITDGSANVSAALDARNTYHADCDTHTGVDDVFFQLGYNWSYCSNDHIGFYFAGVAPTGKDFDNTRWFAPHVGSKHGAVGFGLNGDYTIYDCDADNTDFVFQTEFLYLFRLRHTECRRFDLCDNGSFSRYLLVAEQSNPNAPLTQGDSTNLLDTLTRECVRVEPRHTIQWWANFHYQWCNWAAEFSYNLWWRDDENICLNEAIDFGELGIYSQKCPPRRSNSKAEICTLFDVNGSQDSSFERIQSSNVDLNSAAAQRVLTHKISGAFAYNTVWCDCYPMYVGIGAGYEFASDKHKRHALENWHVYGKWDFAF